MDAREQLRSGELVRLPFLPSSSASLCRLSSQWTLSKSFVPPTVCLLFIDLSIAEPVFRFNLTIFQRPASSCLRLFKLDSVFSVFVNESLRLSFEVGSLRASLFKDSDLRSLKESLFERDSDLLDVCSSLLMDSDLNKLTIRGSIFSSSFFSSKVKFTEELFSSQHSSFDSLSLS